MTKNRGLSLSLTMRYFSPTIFHRTALRPLALLLTNFSLLAYTYNSIFVSFPFSVLSSVTKQVRTCSNFQSIHPCLFLLLFKYWSDGLQAQSSMSTVVSSSRNTKIVEHQTVPKDLKTGASLKMEVRVELVSSLLLQAGRNFAFCSRYFGISQHEVSQVSHWASCLIEKTF